MCSRRVKVKEPVWWCIWLRLLPMTALLMRHWKRVLYVIVLQTAGSPRSRYFKYHQCISTYRSFNESISYTNSSWPSQWIMPSLVQGIRCCLVPSRYQIDAECLWIRPRGTNMSEIRSKTPAFYFKEMHLKILSVKYLRPFRSSFNASALLHHSFTILFLTLIIENWTRCRPYQDCRMSP